MRVKDFGNVKKSKSEKGSDKQRDRQAGICV